MAARIHRLRWQLPACAGLIVCCGGCWKATIPQDSRYAPVRGVVTLNGKPLPRANVMFNSADYRPSAGQTDAEGRYELIYDHRKYGAYIGSHVVRITRHYNPISEPEPKPLPVRYNEKSELKVRVQPGDNVFDFHLIDEETTPAESNDAADAAIPAPP